MSQASWYIFFTFLFILFLLTDNAIRLQPPPTTVASNHDDEEWSSSRVRVSGSKVFFFCSFLYIFFMFHKLTKIYFHFHTLNSTGERKRGRRRRRRQGSRRLKSSLFFFSADVSVVRFSRDSEELIGRVNKNLKPMIKTGLIPSACSDLITDASYDFMGLGWQLAAYRYFSFSLCSCYLFIVFFFSFTKYYSTIYLFLHCLLF